MKNLDSERKRPESCRGQLTPHGTSEVGRKQQEKEKSTDEGSDLDTVSCHSVALLHLLSQFVDPKYISSVPVAMCFGKLGPSPSPRR